MVAVRIIFIIGLLELLLSSSGNADIFEPFLEEFFGVIFRRFNQCLNRCPLDEGQPNEFSSCMCDKHCVIFGDCCYNFYTYCNNFTEETTMTSYMRSGGTADIEKKQTVKEFAKLATCGKFTENPPTQSLFLTIRSCPVDYDDGNIKDMCEGRVRAFPFNIPVSVPTMPYWTFSNVYCSLCHNMTLDDVVFWNTTIQCDIRNEDTVRTLNELVEYQPYYACQTVVTKPRWTKVRKCDLRMVSRCNESTQYITEQHTTEVINLTEDINDTTTASPTNASVSTGSPITGTDGLAAEDEIVSSIPPSNHGSDYAAKNNLPLLCNSYYCQVMYSGKSYFNPHCIGCSHGWEAIPKAHVGCSMFGGQAHGNYFQNTRKVNYLVGRYGNRLIVYSTELQEVLDENPIGCHIDDYFDSLTRKCESRVCPEGFYPYYESCINNTFEIAQIQKTSIISQLHIYAKATLSIFHRLNFNELSETVYSSFQHYQINNVDIYPEFSVTHIPRNMFITLIELVHESHVKKYYGEMGELVGQEFVGKEMRIELNMPVLFNNLGGTLLNVQKAVGFFFDLIIHNLEIRSVSDGFECPVTHQMTVSDVPVLLLNNHAFVQYAGKLYDLGGAIFGIRVNVAGTITLISASFCLGEAIPSEPSVNPPWHNGEEQMEMEAIGGHGLVRDASPLLNCNEQLKVNSSYFNIVDQGVRLSNGLLIKEGDFVVHEGGLIACTDTILHHVGNTSDRKSKVWFKNIIATTSIVLKLISLFVILILRKSENVYFHVLALASSLVDVIHLFEHLQFHNSLKILAILLHFCWLLYVYSSLAWCVNAIWYNIESKLKCSGRHLAISLIVPIATITICATGEQNNPPWGVEYGESGHIFDASKQAVLLGFMLPTAVGVVCIFGCHVCRLVRKSQKLSSSFYYWNIVLTCLLVIQFIFAFTESQTDHVVFYYLYFTFSLVVGSVFLIISINGFPRIVGKEKQQRYTHSTNENGDH